MTQCWYRWINEFDKVRLPREKNDAPEKILDFRCFISDEVNQFANV
ncbi:beta-galactosidase [Mucilaginibacter sp. OK268]|nr:beta-galactosidase [Mucilaginibacter sp. OK268]